MRKTIIVNATALDSSGALTILKQFVSHAKNDHLNKYIIFSPINVELDCSDNMVLFKINKKKWLSRIFWDCYGLSKFLKVNKITCDLFISLQNTSVNLDKSIPQYIYIHQPLPFSNMKIRVDEISDVKLILYKFFYSFFIIFHHNRNSNYIVQTSWMKDALIKKWPDKITNNNVTVIKPDYEFDLSKNINGNVIADSECFRMLYPATPLKYKNHLLILRAIASMKDTDAIDKRILFGVTFRQGEYKKFDRLVFSLGLESNIEYLGFLSREQLIEHYIKADCVVFPSYIETFGLPLSEAASLNKKIVASDLPYARDVLSGYHKVSFAKYDDWSEWSDKLQQVYIDEYSVDKCDDKQYYILEKNTLGWSEFFEFLK
ncbi:glycosyltransferase [Edwardsiella tarda]|uniref:glycosyltransferase n=1 Tax=Edwardsiella tarda TaxID=636 RepID=UPI0011B2A03C|nr:glycosyltransferase [Edwardsiella tarda]UCQ26690.1 glycosyltransferase [Edwardsiella tarda]